MNRSTTLDVVGAFLTLTLALIFSPASSAQTAGDDDPTTETLPNHEEQEGPDGPDGNGQLGGGTDPGKGNKDCINPPPDIGDRRRRWCEDCGYLEVNTRSSQSPSRAGADQNPVQLLGFGEICSEQPGEEPTNPN